MALPLPEPPGRHMGSHLPPRRWRPPAPLRSPARRRLARRRHGGSGGWGERRGQKKPLKVWETSSPAPRASRQRRALGGGAAAPPAEGGAGRSGGSERAWGAQEGAWVCVWWSWGGAAMGRGGCAGGGAAAADRPAGGAPVAVGGTSTPPARPLHDPALPPPEGSSARTSPVCSRTLFLIYPLRLQTRHPRFCSNCGPFVGASARCPRSAPGRHLPGPEFPSASLQASRTARETSLKMQVW